MLDREGAQIGVLISLEEPTKAMRTEAISAGLYDSPWGTKHPKIQLRTVAELLDGKALDLPRTNMIVTYKKARRALGEELRQIPLLHLQQPVTIHPKKKRRRR